MFNNVNDFPTWVTAHSRQDAVYIEVWEPHVGLGDLDHRVQARDPEGDVAEIGGPGEQIRDDAAAGPRPVDGASGEVRISSPATSALPRKRLQPSLPCTAPSAAIASARCGVPATRNRRSP